MTTHPLILKATSAVAALALIASLFGFAMAASVQQAQAATMAEQIICYVDQQLGPDLPFDPQVDYCGGEPTPMLCADGIDNDADGLVDLADPGCSSAQDNSEAGSGGGNGTTTPMLTIVKRAMGGNGTFSFSVNGAGTTSLTTQSG